MFFYSVLAFFVIIFLPVDALAWGPGMHVDVALTMLTKIGLMAPFIRKIIEKYPDAFVYGNASPDIIVGKKYAGYLHHCHSWRMGWLILHEAVTDRQKAAAYGYLTHLAADVVAHNYYIPVKIVRSYSARILTHTYWEMRFDLKVDDRVWDKFKKITDMDIKDFDEMLERVLRKTIFSFTTNKKIFSSILQLQKKKGMRKSLSLYAKRSRFDLGAENFKHYKELTIEAATDFLSNPEKAAVLAMDPTGEVRLAYAKRLRDRIRDMLAFKIIKKKDAEELVELVRESLAIGLYMPDMTLPDVADVIKKKNTKN